MAQIQERHTPIWLLPVIGGVVILAAWFISFYFSYQISGPEREVYQQARQAQVESCERVNDLREETNRSIEVMREFLLEAAVARQASANIAESNGQRQVDLEAAERYRELAARANPIAIPDCDSVIPQWDNVRYEAETNAEQASK